MDPGQILLRQRLRFLILLHKSIIPQVSLRNLRWSGSCGSVTQMRAILFVCSFIVSCFVTKLWTQGSQGEGLRESHRNGPPSLLPTSNSQFGTQLRSRIASLDPLDRSGLIQLFTEVAEQNPDDIIGVFNAFKPYFSPGEVESMAFNVSLHLARKDPAKAVVWVESLPREIREDINSFVFGESIKYFPLDDIIDLALSSKVGGVPFFRIANELAQERNVFEAIEWITERDLAAEPRILNKLVTAEIERNPKSLNTIYQLLHDDVTESTFEHAVGLLAREDSEAANEWISTLENSELREKCEKSVLYETILKTHDHSLLPTSPSHASTVVSAWALRNWQEAYEWLTEKAPHDTEALGVIFSYPAQDVEAAAATLSGLLAERPSLDSHLAEAAEKMALHLYLEKPDSAKTWLSSLPEGSVRDRAITSYVKEAAATDPASLLQWFDELENIPDAATGELVAQFAGDLPTTLYSASKIADHTYAHSILESLSADWRAFDEQFFEKSLRDSPLDQKLKDSLMEVELLVD